MLRFHVVAPALASFLLTFALVSGTGCGTDAKSVDECRDIEQARCEAARPCGLVDDVDECKRFFRDHCLHGMPVKSPGQSQVDECVAAIKEAGEKNECSVVLHPERTAACAFLNRTPEPDSGKGGKGGKEGGASGKDPDPAGAGGHER